MIKDKNSKKPLVAFMPYFQDLGETFPLVEIAKKYRELGGDVVFVSYGGRYEKLAEDSGFKIVKIKLKSDEETYKVTKKREYNYNRKKKATERFIFDFFYKKYQKFYIESIDEEIKAFKNEKVDLVVSSIIVISKISARFVGVPIVFLVSGVATPPYFESNYASFPDNYENYFTRLVPQPIKNRVTNWYTLNCKWSVRGYNRLAKVYKVPKVKHFLDLFAGDYVLVADDIELLDLKPTPKYPLENFVGPIIFDQQDQTKIDSDIESHLKKPGKSILLTMGSVQTWKKTFFDILEILNKTKYNVVAISYKSDEIELPELNDNILFKTSVPSIKKINEMVDLAIIHGGRGTVYTAAYSGKPVIGIPVMAEQQFNLDNLVKHGMAIRLSKKYLTEKKLVDAIDKIFDNYDKYLENAQLLKNKLQAPNGAENAAKRILEIATREKKLRKQIR